MQRRGIHVGPTGREFLRRVVQAGKADAFTFDEVLEPQDRTRFLAALDHLLELEYVERVSVGCGRWFYRLTAAGRELGARAEPAKGKKKKQKREPTGGKGRHRPRSKWWPGTDSKKWRMRCSDTASTD